MHFRPSHIARGLLVGLLLLTVSQPARAAGIGNYTAPFQSLLGTFESVFGQLLALVEPHHTVTVTISPLAKWHASGKTASAAAFNSILATSQPAAAPTIVHIDTAPKASTPALHTIVTASSISPAPVANLAGYVTQEELSAQLSDLTSSMHNLVYNQNAQSTSSLYASLWGALALSQRIDNLPSTVTVGGSTVVTQSSLPALSGMSGLLGVSQGGTGTTTAPAYGQILVGNSSGGYTLMATSSLGLAGGGSNPWTLSGSNVTYTGGNVGIGTTSPSQVLSVQGNGLFSGNLTASNIAATGTLSVTGLTTLGNATTTYQEITNALTFSGNRTYSGTGTSSPSNSFMYMPGSALFGTAAAAPNGIISPFNIFRRSSRHDHKRQWQSHRFFCDRGGGRKPYRGTRSVSKLP